MEGGRGKTERRGVGSEVGEEGAEDCHDCLREIERILEEILGVNGGKEVNIIMFGGKKLYRVPEKMPRKDRDLCNCRKEPLTLKQLDVWISTTPSAGERRHKYPAVFSEYLPAM